MIIFAYALINKLDQITKMYSLEVAHLVESFAMHIGNYSDSLYVGALLRDIGNLKIDTNLLYKHGPLTLEEQDLLEKHTEYGLEVIKNTHLAKDEVLCSCIKYHHTKLYNKDLPIEPKIISICAAYHSMITTLGNNIPLSKEEAIKKLLEGKDTKFDGDLLLEFVEFIK